MKKFQQSRGKLQECYIKKRNKIHEQTIYTHTHTNARTYITQHELETYRIKHKKMFNLIHNKKNIVRSHRVILSHYETGKNSKAKQYTFGKAVGKQLLSQTAIENSENVK